VAEAAYTHGHHDSVLRSHRWRTLDNSAAYLAARLSAGQAVLDVGCGPGTITADLAERVAPGTVTGVDTAAAVLEEARAVAAGRGLDTLVFETADVHALPYPDDSFDVVHAHQVLQHLDDPVGALREMRRVCRPGGIVAARDADYGAMAWYPETPAMEEWRRLYRQVARANGGEPDAGRRMLAWARQAGLEDIVPTASLWCYATPGDRDWWAGLWAERTVASAYAERAVAGGHTDEQGLRRIAEGWHAWSRSGDGWFTVPHGEILCTA
jgi:ubiquinone/menaquinone biosynthesis C-methylase UbiE